MITNELHLNCLTWSRYGTTLEIGYSVRGDDDELTLGHFEIVVDNDKVEPLVAAIMKQFDWDIRRKLDEETDR